MFNLWWTYLFPSPCFAGPQFDIPCYEFVAAWKEKVDSFMAETKDVLKITSIALAESSFVIISREKIEPLSGILIIRTYS